MQSLVTEKDVAVTWPFVEADPFGCPAMTTIDVSNEMTLSRLRTRCEHVGTFKATEPNTVPTRTSTSFQLVLSSLRPLLTASSHQVRQRAPKRVSVSVCR